MRRRRYSFSELASGAAIVMLLVAVASLERSNRALRAAVDSSHLDRSGLATRLDAAYESKAAAAAREPNDGTRNVWDLHEATWHCEGGASRVGKVGDGGKWVCDLHQLRRDG